MFNLVSLSQLFHCLRSATIFAELVEGDPLSGLDELAKQVAAATIPDALAVGNDLGRIAEFVYTSE
jgi:hypothetical protein